MMRKRIMMLLFIVPSSMVPAMDHSAKERFIEAIIEEIFRPDCNQLPNIVSIDPQVTSSSITSIIDHSGEGCDQSQNTATMDPQELIRLYEEYLEDIECGRRHACSAQDFIVEEDLESLIVQGSTTTFNGSINTVSNPALNHPIQSTITPAAYEGNSQETTTRAPIVIVDETEMFGIDVKSYTHEMSLLPISDSALIGTGSEDYNRKYARSTKDYPEDKNIIVWKKRASKNKDEYSKIITGINTSNKKNKH